MAIRSFSKSRLALAASGAALVFVPSAAWAQALSGTSASLAWSKSEAILGAPSALQAVLAQQQAGTPVRAVAPASYSIPRIEPAILRTRPRDDGALNGRPDVFGSVA